MTPNDQAGQAARQSGVSDHDTADAARFVEKMDHAPHQIDRAALDAYWKKNVRLLLILLAVWFSVSYGAGILFVDYLNQFEIGGFKLGFWFGQQGAIYTFVALIFIYCWQMSKLERQVGISDDDVKKDAY